MGKYINGIGHTFAEKNSKLVREHDAQPVKQPAEFVKDLVCVVDNGEFAAAAWMYSKEEFECWMSISDRRPKAWFIVPNVENLSQ